MSNNVNTRIFREALEGTPYRIRVCGMRNICPALDRAKAATALKPRILPWIRQRSTITQLPLIRFLEGDDVFGLRVRPDEDSGRDNEH
jgi:hypothetical protein